MNGEVHPELIPDIVAFRLFFGATYDKFSVSDSLQLRATSRQISQLHSIGLSDADFQAVLIVVSDFHAAVSADLASAKSLDTASAAALEALSLTMSPGGLEQLQAFVRSEKKNMRRTVYPDMSGHAHN